VEQDESAIVRRAVALLRFWHWLSFFGEKLPLAAHGAFGRALQHDMTQHPQCGDAAARRSRNPSDAVVYGMLTRHETLADAT